MTHRSEKFDKMLNKNVKVFFRHGMERIGILKYNEKEQCYFLVTPEYDFLFKKSHVKHIKILKKGENNDDFKHNNSIL